MKLPLWRPIAAITIVLATIGAFVYYFIHNPSVGEQLSRTSPTVIAIILALYFCTVGALALINSSTLRLCRLRMSNSESLLLTAYSSVINFFGPLQSGPAFRAVYLKSKYKLNLKNYGVATLVYYFFYAAFSAMFLFFGVLKWWLIVPVVLGIIVVIALRQDRLALSRLSKLDLTGWYFLAAASFLQVSLVAAIYFTELRSLAPNTTLTQAIIYTGAANFALFVSLTPGAIGFRESFLLFTQRLHHIDSSTIVAANILDRAMYVVLLLILALFIFGTHASKQLKSKVETK
ncbi:MAG: lysylphosphatidylglycerol synthase domain-containing protein [Patescibacteria group bacterium]